VAAGLTGGTLQEQNMPYVNIKVTREGTAPGATATTPEQKAALIKGVSELLLDVMGKPLTSTFVVIEEVEMENWGVGGVPTPEYRKRMQQKDKPAK
jgi:4-oxalocrotonate tautomerase